VRYDFIVYRASRRHDAELSVSVLAAWGSMKRVIVLEALVCNVPVFSVLILRMLGATEPEFCLLLLLP